MREQQLRQVRSGCGGCFVFVLAIALFLGGYGALQQWLRGPALGGVTPDMIVLARPEKHANAIVWIGAFTLIIAVAALAARSTARAIGQALLVVIAGGATIGWVCCGRFEALRPFADHGVELVYVWPRLNVRIDARQTVVRVESEVTEIADTPTSVDFLVLEISGERYRSAAAGNFESAQQLLTSRGAKWTR